jgi:hypothetical protein
MNLEKLSILYPVILKKSALYLIKTFFNKANGLLADLRKRKYKYFFLQIE